MIPKSESAEQTPHQHKRPMVEAPPALKLESAPPPIGKLSTARAAVQQFLSIELGAREVRITKIVPIAGGADGWSVEAEMLVPNLEVKMLGLPLTQEVLEREHYALELAADLTVRSYEHFGPGDN
jgi:hypothetical protein